MKLIGALLLLALSAVPDDKSELVAEFRRYYAKAKTPAERYEAVQVLKDVDTLESAQALAAALDDDDFGVRRAAVDVIGSFRTPETAHWLVDGVLLEKKQRKTGVKALAAEALGRMGQDFAYWPLAALLDERDPELRLAAIAALGSLKNPDACAKLSELAGSTDGTIALAAVDALARLGSAPGAEAAVIAATRHADWRVRARAIDAILTLKLKNGIGPLIERLRVEDGRLAGDAYQALKSLTLRDLSDQADVWTDWWTSAEANFQLPDYEKIAAARAATEKNGTRYTKGKKQFLGMETRSENILFVIDVSGSMEVPFGDPDRLKSLGRTYKSNQRLEIVKEELTHTVEELPETTGFNIIAFARDVKSWKKDAVKANVLNKSNAASFISQLKPLGGEKAGFRARLGFETNAAEEGATNTYLALMTALGESVDNKGAEGFVISAPRTPLDTIFFLTDGEPTVGKTVDMPEIRREVQRVNAYRGVQIHVIYVGEDYGGDELEKLAHENGGVFVSIGG